MEQITLILDNLRSAHNVGAIIRSAAAFGIEHIVCTGVTPYPQLSGDSRLPHVASRAHQAITKTALGAEKEMTFTYFEHIDTFLEQYPEPVYAVEQTARSIRLPDFTPQPPCTLIIGNEVDGISKYVIARIHGAIEIPQETARKESLNAATACGVVLYDCYVKLKH